MANKRDDHLKQLDRVIDLLRFLIAIELCKGGLPQAEIGKRLGIAAGSVNRYVKGIKRESDS